MEIGQFGPFRYRDIAEIPVVFCEETCGWERLARVHRSQSGCDMLIRAFISQPALMSVASRQTNDSRHRFSSSFHPVSSSLGKYL